jgi:hypothetical protein
MGSSTQSPWSRVIETNRPFVPLIECCAGMGSGLLISPDAMIVTNRHVIEGATMAMITFYDGTKAKALVIHKHDYRDLAMLRAAINCDKHFNVASDISTISVGEEVLAIGHPRGLTFTVTRGIVSETSRQLAFGKFVQTDVAINPGNSGGPLLDGQGRLVGLNTHCQLDAHGLGFAIPGDEVRQYVQQVHEMIIARKLPYPSDAEICAVPRQLSATEVLHAAVTSSGLRVAKGDKRKDGIAYTLFTSSGAAFVAGVGKNWFEVRWSPSGRLNPARLNDPQFLLGLLKWQGESTGPRFLLRDDRLQLSLGRDIEGLDVAEARELILTIADAVEQIAPWLSKHLGP